MRRKFRLDTTNPTIANETLQVDRENLRINGTVAALAHVEALGHDLWSDTKTIEILAALGNKAYGGIRMRFGHPGISDNAMGRKVGRAFNFRVEENKLLHDVRLFAPAEDSPVLNKPVSYIMEMAEQHPEEIAESVVILIDAMWTLDDGRELNADDDSAWPDDVITDGSGRPVNATTPYPVIRPLTFYYTDFVSEGALTHDGLFSANPRDFFVGTSQHAAQIFEVMDDLQATYGLTEEDMRRKADALFNTYKTWRMGEMSMSEKDEKVTPSETTEAKTENHDLSALLAESAEVAESVEKKPEVQYVTVEQYNLLVAQFNALTERFNEVVEVAKNQQKVLTALTRQHAKYSGETVVKQVVGAHASPALVPLAPVNPLNEIAQGNIAPPQRIASANPAVGTAPKNTPGLGSGMRLSGAGK